jgi:hypothetical protein
MNLMKWLRKNNKKLMAVVVIVLMVAFIGGSSFHYLFQGSGGAKAAVAYYGHNQKITHLDRSAANQELDILTALGADGLLRQQDMRGLLLSELVFRESRNAGMVDMARQAIQRNRFRISDKQLSELFTDHSTVPPDLFWILLCNEARNAGIFVGNEEVGRSLEQAIPRWFKRPYSQVISSLMNRYGVPEETILTTFGKLLAVLQYAQIISSVENVTTAQIKHMARDESESLSTEFVQFKASYFADKAQTPPEQALTEQFNRYKDSFPGDVSEANPFGFGYRLPDRIQFDYIAVKLADVAGIIKAPTEEEAEQYYQVNRDRQFTEKVPADPNDPNSAQVAKIRPYAEVADTIMSELRHQRLTTKAEQILQEARNQADAELRTVDPNGKAIPLEQRRKNAGDYEKIAADLHQTYNLPLYSGRTGLLSAINMQDDKVLRRMFLPVYGHNPVPLTQALFSVKELGDDATILLSMPRTEMYASVGPMQDPMVAPAADLTDRIMMIARVVAVERNAPPTGLDMTFSTRTLGLGDAPKTTDNDVFSVKEQVVDDVRALAAWDTTKSKAEEFLALATKDGWEKAVAQFNQLYGKQAKTEPNDPNVFKVDSQAGLQRIPSAEFQVLAAQVANSPAAPVVLNQARNAGQFVDLLYSLVPAERDMPEKLPLVVASQSSQSYYVLKSLSVQRLTKENFQKMKGMIVRREEYSQIENLAAVHFSPASILKRMNFRYAHPTNEPNDSEAPSKAKEAS